MLTINNWSVQELKKKYPNYTIKAPWKSGSWQTSRYIQLLIPGMDEDVHYEYLIDSNWEGRVELHFEGDWESKYSLLIDGLMNNTQNCDELTWSSWAYGYRCQHCRKINKVEELYQTLSDMMKKFDKLIHNLTSELPTFEEKSIDCNGTLPNVETLDIFEKKYGEIIRLPLSIPNYQRIYCWEENNVKCLLDDVSEHISVNNKTPYRLGTIILHFHNNKYDIIDGQQRLVTLALLLSEIGVKTSLLNEQLTSQRSIDYIAYNKHIIHEYVQRHLNTYDYAEKLMDILEFSVLVLNNTSIDLEYTFF